MRKPDPVRLGAKEYNFLILQSGLVSRSVSEHHCSNLHDTSSSGISFAVRWVHISQKYQISGNPVLRLYGYYTDTKKLIQCGRNFCEDAFLKTSPHSCKTHVILDRFSEIRIISNFAYKDRL